MVKRCTSVGVEIYVDAVVNHMTAAGSGRGSSGSTYSDYNYPGVPYSSFDFHYCGRDEIEDYRDRYQVQFCELVNLVDLKTESDYVRQRIADYLQDLMSIGVTGFRIDAAKHMPAADIAAIVTKLSGNPKIFSEVIEAAGEPVRANEYFNVADEARVTEFRYGRDISANVQEKGKMKYFRTFGEGWGLMPSGKALAFIDNHDNQRGHGGGGVSKELHLNVKIFSSV